MLDFAYLPAGLDPLPALALVALSCLTSAITATFGLGGGALMIAVMALIFPPAVAVPLHGLVQLGSNAGRALLLRAYVQWKFVGFFILGSAAGSLLGARIATSLPEALFTAAIAIFILWSVWAPKPTAVTRGPIATATAGLVTSALGMVIGVSGPLVLAFLSVFTDRREIIGTHALLMTMQNLFKALAFTIFGFAFAPYLPLVGAMVASGFIGTLLGTGLLHRVPEHAFRWGFKIILSVLATYLLFAALS